MLSILNTSVSAGARNNLQVANLKMGKAIERLSSGLRINRAADDPSGLSISERMRTQINGYERASLNSQDAISYYQTAEGALNETNSILQRMRELSIQAANGTLTSSDRQSIQHEIDQLSDEVDRIAKSTEFNTKKLLNGDASALWSSTSNKVNAVIRGKVAEGNYELEINQEPVENHVLKTDIFKVKEGVQSVDNVELNGTKASIKDTDTAGADAIDVTFTFDDGVERTITDTTAGLQSAVDAINNDEVASQYVTAYFDSGGAVTVEALNEGDYANSFSIRSNISDTGAYDDYLFYNATAGTATATFGDDSYEFHNAEGETSESGIVGIEDPDHLISGFSGTASYTMAVDTSNTFDGTNTGEIKATFSQGTANGFSAASTINNLDVVSDDDQDIEIQAGGANLMIEALETTGFTDSGDTGDFKLRFSFDDGENWTVKTFNKDADFADTTTGIQITDGISSVNLTGTDAIQFNAGDKMLIALTDNESASTGTNADDFTVTTEIGDGLGNATQSSRTYRFVDGVMDKTDAELSVVQLDIENGDWNVGAVTVNFGNNDVSTGEVKFDIESGGIAGKDTELWKIDRFYDGDGNFVLGEYGAYIDIYDGYGNSGKIHIDAENTIGELTEKINNALRDDLDMGVGKNSVDNNLATYVNEPASGTDESVQGTMVIRSSKMGDKGRVSFSGREDVLNALSLATIQDPGKDPMTITVRDAHTGEIVGSERTSDNTLRNVIEGVDVEFDPRLDIDINWNETDRTLTFASEPGTLYEYLHVVDNAKDFQIGANPNQTVRSHIGEMSAHALGLNRVLVVNQEGAQNSISLIDSAIDRVSAERARMGAVINRLEHTINNLSVQQENAIASESRIRDIDMAKEATEMTKAQMLSQAATAMLAQANQMGAGLLQLLQ